MAVLILVSTCCYVLASILPIWRASYWWVRVCEFPRLQLLCWGFANMGLAFILADQSTFWWIFGVNAIGLFYHLSWIYRFFFFYPVEVKQAQPGQHQAQLSILSSNVYMQNPHKNALLALVDAHKPDVFILLESDIEWQRAADQLQLTYPHSVKIPLDNEYGMHLYAKLPLLDAQTHYRIKKDIPSITCKVLLPCGAQVLLYVLHPEPPSPTEAETSGPRDVELIEVAKEIKHQSLPVIVSGDLNDVAWSRTTDIFKRLSGTLDPRVGRGFFNTFHARLPFARWPLDHIFHSQSFYLLALKRLYLKGSDHFALLTHLALVQDSDNPQQPDATYDQALVEQRLDEEM